MSLDTIQRERNLDLYVPFDLRPLSAVIESQDSGWAWEFGQSARAFSALRRGDEVLAINGRAFVGYSAYLRELWNAQNARDIQSFTVSVRSVDGKERILEFGWPHCTCGVPELWQAYLVWLFAPMFCVALGFSTALSRPTSALAWCWLCLMLALSQLQYWEEGSGLQLTATPMLWPDGAREAGVAFRAFAQTAWPAPLALMTALLSRSDRKAMRFAVLLSGSVILYAVVDTVFALAWSENFRPFAPAYRLAEPWRTELTIASFISFAVLGWWINRKLGVVIGILALAAALVLTWSTNPRLVIFGFTAAAVCVAVVATRRRRAIAGLLLCGTLATHVGNVFAKNWWPFMGPAEYWPWIVLGTTGLGLLLLNSWILLRSRESDLWSNRALWPLNASDR